MKQTMTCCNVEMSNFGYYERLADKRTPHFYCAECGRHRFKGKSYTAEEWFFYINGTIYNRQSHILGRKHVHTVES